MRVLCRILLVNCKSTKTVDRPAHALIESDGWE